MSPAYWFNSGRIQNYPPNTILQLKNPEEAFKPCIPVSCSDFPTRRNTSTEKGNRKNMTCNEKPAGFKVVIHNSTADTLWDSVSGTYKEVIQDYVEEFTDPMAALNEFLSYTTDDYITDKVSLVYIPKGYKKPKKNKNKK